MANTTSNLTFFEDMGIFKPVYDSCLIVLAVAIVVINVLVVYLFVRKDYLRTKTNSFLVSLAVSDFCTGFLSIPLYLICPVTTSPQICLASGAIYRCIAVSTMAHIMVVTLERYVAVMFPMRYYRMVTKRRMCFFIGLVWVFAIFYATIPFSWLDVSNHNLTSVEAMEDISNYEKVYNFSGVVVCFAIPLLVILFCFTRMFFVIRRQVRNIRRQAELAADPRNRSIASDKRALIIFATMSGIFAICWLSWYITLIQVELGQNAILPETMMDVLDFFRFATSLINPMLYTFLKNDFRRAVCSLFASCCVKSPIFKPTRRDSGACRTTLTTDANVNKSTALLNGHSPGHDRLNESPYQGSQDIKQPENTQLITHV